MNPEYPGQNPYDFILNPQAPQKPKKQLLGGNSFILKLVLIIGGVGILMIVTAIILNIATANRVDTTDLQALAKTQQEVIRVASEGMNSARNQNNKNMATSVALSVETQQKALLNFLETQDIKLSAKELSSSENADITTQLKDAKATSTYDVVFPQVMQKLLSDYTDQLRTIYNGMSDPELRTMLNNDFNQAQLLEKQIPSSDGETETDTTTQTTQ